MTPQVYEATKRLISLANGDSGGSRVARNFVLAWWNFENFGGFDLNSMADLDVAHRADIATVVVYLSEQSNATYPYEFRKDIEQIIIKWRPDVL